MSNQLPPRLPDHDPVIYRQHRRQVNLQVLLPVLLGALVVVILSVLASLGTNSNTQVAQWGHISTVIVVLPALVSCLLALVVTAGLAYLITRVLKILPPKLYAAQIWTAQFSLRMKGFADALANPVISIRSKWAAFRRLFER